LIEINLGIARPLQAPFDPSRDAKYETTDAAMPHDLNK